jgi:tetratricopeptide (TPR) repeat protein
METLAHKLGLVLVPYLKYRSLFRDAMVTLGSSERAARLAGDKRAAAQCRGAIGDIHRLQGDTDASIRELSASIRGLRIARASQRDIAEFLVLLGHAYRQNVELAEASQAYESALRAFRDQGDDAQSIRLQSEVGLTAALAGDLAGGQLSLETALAWAQAEPGSTTAATRRRAWIQQHLASVMRFREEYSRALSIHSAALEEFRSVGDRHGLGYAQFGIADSLAHLDGAGERSRAALGDAMATFAEIGNDRGSILANLALDGIAGEGAMVTSAPLIDLLSELAHRRHKEDGSLTSRTVKAVLWGYGPQRASSVWDAAREALVRSGEAAPVDFAEALEVSRNGAA